MPDKLMAPPIRTALVNNPDGSPVTGPANGSNDSSSAPITTEKSWYFYWRDIGKQINTGTDTLGKLVTYGAHADRPDPANMPDGAIYIETDRGSIYQLEGGVWQFITGTMWNTLSPDQRPTDLGTHDAGFDFRTTDQPAREFIWSQTEWIEATPVRYGTHAARLAVVVAQVIDQLLWVETDRGAIYQHQASVWQYLAGTMWGTMVPDQRPTDLGTHDAGFDFRTTDAPPREFIWNQTAWVETTPPQVGLAQYAIATAALTLPTAAADIPGATLTLTRAGKHLITGCFDIGGSGAGDAGFLALGQLVADGTAQTGLVVFQPLVITSTGTSAGTLLASPRYMTFQQWSYQAAAPGKVVTLQAWKNGGSGVSQAGAQTTISALWVSP